MFVSGEAYIELDGRGRLIYLKVLPPQLDEASGAAPAPTGRRSSMRPASTRQNGRSGTGLDTTALCRYAGGVQGALPERPDVPMRIEAAAYRGKPVSWDLIGPWSRPGRMVPYTFSRGSRLAFSSRSSFWSR